MYTQPATWQWDFAGLATSSDTNPVFTFPAPGLYTVCLTACNSYSCDTLCRDVLVGLVSDVEPVIEGADGFRIVPNPSSGAFDLFFEKANIDWKVYIISGKELTKGTTTEGLNRIDIRQALNGLYLLALFDYPTVFF